MKDVEDEVLDAVEKAMEALKPGRDPQEGLVNLVLDLERIFNEERRLRADKAYGLD